MGTFFRPLRAAVTVFVMVGVLGPQLALAEGASIGRYTPPLPGSAAFWVDDPQYHPSFGLGAALTLDYAHDPLVVGFSDGSGFQESRSLIEHQLFGHLQIAASFSKRVALGLSLPVGLWEGGEAGFAVAPSDGVGLGDMRAFGLLRLVGDGRKDAFSSHLGLSAWLPTASEAHNGDQSVRVQARLLLSGRVDWLRWGASGGFMYREKSTLGNLPASPGNTVGSEIDLAARVGWATPNDSFTVAPEIILASSVPDGRYLQRSYTHLETTLGAHVRVADDWLLSAGPGLGFLKQPGTPDFRMLVRVAWAPREAPPPRVKAFEEAAPPPPPPDGDEDGIVDADDACPAVAGVASSDPEQHGCPADGDKDGVVDSADTCPTEHHGEHPDPTRTGCPAIDTDSDGVWDHMDVCVNEPVGPLPDPSRKGCPLPDRDGDTVGDAEDACPDKAGAPHPDPKKHGCPGLVEVREGKLVILKPVFFATNKDKVLAKSFPVLTAVADALLAQPQVRKVLIEGHTDDRGNVQKNTVLSQKRAQSVMNFLLERGVDASRLTAEGFGPSQPLETNKTSKGRAANRRVEFRILERNEVTP